MVSNAVFRTLALQFENCSEAPHFEKTSFRVKNKIFASLDEKNNRAVIRLDAINQSVFSAFDKNVIHPVEGAWGRQGWTMVELRKVRKDLLKDALSVAYELLVQKKTGNKSGKKTKRFTNTSG